MINLCVRKINFNDRNNIILTSKLTITNIKEICKDKSL